MKTVKVRIAVAVDRTGKWNSCGWHGGDDTDKMSLCVEPLEDGEARYWLEAVLAVPDSIQTVQAKVTPA